MEGCWRGTRAVDTWLKLPDQAAPPTVCALMAEPASASLCPPELGWRYDDFRSNGVNKLQRGDGPNAQKVWSTDPGVLTSGCTATLRYNSKAGPLHWVDWKEAGAPTLKVSFSHLRLSSLPRPLEPPPPPLLPAAHTSTHVMMSPRPGPVPQTLPPARITLVLSHAVPLSFFLWHNCLPADRTQLLAGRRGHCDETVF